MKREFVTHYSTHLQREMHMLVYGETGVPVLSFPCQDGMGDNWESFQMPEELSAYIESGQMQLFCVDTVDTESWADKAGDKDHRAWIQEMYFRYITEEALAEVQKINGTGKLALATGYSLGALHAAIVFFRRPDLFRGVLSCSGCYDGPHFFEGWCSSTLYDNSPLDFLKNMPKDHPYIELYNQKKIVLCVGQGRWEDDLLASTRRLDTLLAEKNVPHWFDYWGFDVDHDWPWWRNQIWYFMNKIV